MPVAKQKTATMLQFFVTPPCRGRFRVRTYFRRWGFLEVVVDTSPLATVLPASYARTPNGIRWLDFYTDPRTQ